MQQMPGILVQARLGICATLQLEVVEGGRGEFSPAAEMALTVRRPDFDEAFSRSYQFLVARQLWPKGCDVRWRLSFLDPCPPHSLDGLSLTVSLAFGTAWLVARHGLALAPPRLVPRLRAVHDPGSLCFSGALSESGELCGLSGPGVIQKVQCAQRDDRIRLLILPESARADMDSTYARHRSLHAPNTFVGMRDRPNAPGLTVLCESQLFCL